MTYGFRMITFERQIPKNKKINLFVLGRQEKFKKKNPPQKKT